MALRTVTLFCLLTLVGLHHPAQAQTALKATGSVYKSDIDELLTIQTVSVLPFSDNLQGIYARPLESHFNETLGKMHRWDLVPVNQVGPVLSPEELEEDPGKVKQMSAGISADAFFACRVSKGPNGVSLVLSLFLTKDSKLLAKATFKDAKRFDIKDLQEQIDVLLGHILEQLPYSGRVLSRDGNRITVSLGKRDGVQAGQILSVIQIISANRHPKFNFLISTEKEIIGRAKIIKVDDTLSFATLVAEKERGAVQKNAKIAGLDFVTYPETDSLNTESADIAAKEEGKISFGDTPAPWLPRRTPTFGQVGARLGDTMYNSSTKVTGVGSLDGSTMLAPSVFLEGELWLTSEFSLHASMRQGIIPMSNPRSGASPSKLNQSVTAYDMLFGYNFRTGPGVWGSNVELLAGYMYYKMFVDDSTPESLTGVEYSGLKTGVKGQFPVSADKLWSAGAQLFIVLMPHLSESPATSGDHSSSTINTFGIFGGKKIAENLRLQGNLDFELYSSSFTGTGTRANPATSLSQRHTTFSGGIYYLF